MSAPPTLRPSPHLTHAAWWAQWRAVYAAATAPVVTPRDETAVRPDIERQLALSMRSLERDHGGATVALLRQQGFTTAELREHGEGAASLARRMREAEEGGRWGGARRRAA